jgi:NAD dependent epimerase/dehydratase family enzyme
MRAADFTEAAPHDCDLVPESRRVVPGRLLAAGFRFEFPTWPEAVRDLAGRCVRA